MIPVQERQNLILAVGVQTRGRAHWNIQATMVQCGHVSLDWRGKVGLLTHFSPLTSCLRYCEDLPGGGGGRHQADGGRNEGVQHHQWGHDPGQQEEQAVLHLGQSETTQESEGESERQDKHQGRQSEGEEKEK